MKSSRVALCAILLTVPACIGFGAEDPPSNPGCEAGGEGEWEGEEVDRVEMVYGDLRNLVYWHKGVTGNAVVVGTSGVPAPGDHGTSLTGSGTLVAGGSEYLYVWVDTAAEQLLGQRVDFDGAPIGEAFAIAAAGGHAEIRAFCDGERYWILWADETSDAVRVQVARVGLDGQLLDAAPIRFATGNVFAGDIAGNGDLVWAVWSRDWQIEGVRIAADGTVLDAEPFSLLDTQTSATDLVANGDEVLLVGQDASGDRPLKVQRLGPEGPRSEPTVLGYEPDSWRRTEVEGLFVDPTRDGYVLVAGRYEDSNRFVCTDCEVEAYRLDADGTATDDGPFAVFPGADPAVTFNGVHLLVAYLAHTYDGHYEDGDHAQWQLETRAVYLDGAVGGPIPLDAAELEYAYDCF